MYTEEVPFQLKSHLFGPDIAANWAILEHLYSEMAAESLLIEVHCI